MRRVMNFFRDYAFDEVMHVTMFLGVAALVILGLACLIVHS